MNKAANTLFAPIPQDAQAILNSFDSLLQDTVSLSGKQIQILPSQIRKLSQQLTNERSSRRQGYMNDTLLLSAYCRYFMWWNLVRLTSVFAGLAPETFAFLQNGDYCLDIGSGPLTLPLALYLSRPELRKVKLNWYCMDISHNALSLGENLFLSAAARLSALEPWNIIRIRGAMGTSLKHSPVFISCANMFNELYLNTSRPLEEEAKKYGISLLAYKKDDRPSAVFIAEPGIPRTARFISLLRDFLLRQNFSLISPCTHEKTCPMDGRRGGKWCHFILDARAAPEKLQKLSNAAGLAKERASISFVFAAKPPLGIAGESSLKNPKFSFMRIVSDPILIPKRGSGRYACATWGLSLVMDNNAGTKATLNSGDTLQLSLSNEEIRKLPIDEKTHAKIIE